MESEKGNGPLLNLRMEIDGLRQPQSRRAALPMYNGDSVWL